MKVTIFHNETVDPQGRHVAWLDGYRAGHRLVEVFTYEVDQVAKTCGGVADPLCTVDEAFELFNVGDDPEFRAGGPDATAVAYRALGLRSLSVGDVVQVDDVAFACASFGWDQVDPSTLPSAG